MAAPPPQRFGGASGPAPPHAPFTGVSLPQVGVVLCKLHAHVCGTIQCALLQLRSCRVILAAHALCCVEVALAVRITIW